MVVWQPLHCAGKMDGLITLRRLASTPPETRRNVIRHVGKMLFFDALMILLLFVAAGVGGTGSRKENSEKWDNVLTGLIVPSFLSLYLAAPLGVPVHTKYRNSPGSEPKIDTGNCFLRLRVEMRLPIL